LTDWLTDCLFGWLVELLNDYLLINCHIEHFLFSKCCFYCKWFFVMLTEMHRQLRIILMIQLCFRTCKKIMSVFVHCLLFMFIF